MNKNFRTVLLYLVLLAVLVWFVMIQMGKTTVGPKALATSEFVSAVQEGRVSDATYVVRDSKLAGTFWATLADKNKKEKPVAFTSTYVGSDSLSELMARNPDVTYKVDAAGPPVWISIQAALDRKSTRLNSSH